TIPVWTHSSSPWVSKVGGSYSSSKMHYSASLYQAQGQVSRQGPCREESTQLRSLVTRALGKSPLTLETQAG
uniref:Uncharacterized protein n=1 Tax=Cricetulus griseus TaxID=10029 RepID=A0A8C2LIU5_CRIGR